MDDYKIVRMDGESKPGIRTCRQISRAAVFVLTIIFVLTVMPVLADPPPPEDCGAGENEPFMACEDKQLTAQKNLLDELDVLLNVIEQTQTVDMKALTLTNAETGEENDLREHMAGMKNKYKRAEEMLSESTETEFEEMIAKGGGKEKDNQKCEWLESEDVQLYPEEYLPAGLSEPFDGLGDGICDRFEAWDVEKEKTVTIRERSLSNVCEKVCQEKEVHGQPGKYKKDKIKGRHLGRKSEGIDATKKLTEKVKQAQVDIATAQAMAEAFRITKNLAADDIPWEECEQNDKTAQIVAWYVKIGAEAVLLGAKLLTRLAEGIHEGSKVVCQQDAVGANVSITCAGGVAYWQFCQAAVDLVEAVIAGTELTIDHGNFFNVDDAFECINKVRTSQKEMLEKVKENNLLVRDINKKAGDAASGIIELKRLVLENREYIKDNRNLALTPHGRRDDQPLYEAPPPPPVIVSVKGAQGSTTLTVSFNEGVWTGTGQSGPLGTGDFTLTDNAPSAPESIIAVVHTAGSARASLTLDKPLDGDEFSFDTLAANANAIFNQFDIPMDETIEYYIE